MIEAFTTSFMECISWIGYLLASGLGIVAVVVLLIIAPIALLCFLINLIINTIDNVKWNRLSQNEKKHYTDEMIRFAKMLRENKEEGEKRL